MLSISPERMEFAKAQNELHKMRYQYWITVAQTTEEILIRAEALGAAQNFLQLMQEYLDLFGDYIVKKVEKAVI